MLLLNIIRRYKTQKGIKVLLMNYYKHVYYTHFFLELLQVQDKINCSSIYLLFPPEVIVTKTKIRFHCQRTEDYKACKQPFTPCNGSTSDWISAKLHRGGQKTSTHTRWELPQISSAISGSLADTTYLTKIVNAWQACFITFYQKFHWGCFARGRCWFPVSGKP